MPAIMAVLESQKKGARQEVLDPPDMADQSTSETAVEGLAKDFSERTNGVTALSEAVGNGVDVVGDNKPQAAKIVGTIAREIGIPAAAAEDPKSEPGRLLLAVVASVTAVLAWRNKDKK